MKLGHIVKYGTTVNVFFKYGYALYRTMSSEVIALCSWNNTIVDGVPSLSLAIFLLGHNIQYQNVFLQFDNGAYHLIQSWVIAFCSWKMALFINDVLSLNQVILRPKKINH